MLQVARSVEAALPKGDLKAMLNNTGDSSNVQRSGICYRDNNSVKVEVSDTGIGIKKENLERIFNHFIRVENESISEHHGTGLGLSISKKLIELLQGSISVKSEFGVGSTFTVILPLNV